MFTGLIATSGQARCVLGDVQKAEATEPHLPRDVAYQLLHAAASRGSVWPEMSRSA
jgi:hypothetical protein